MKFWNMRFSPIVKQGARTYRPPTGNLVIRNSHLYAYGNCRYHNGQTLSVYVLSFPLHSNEER